MKFWRDRRTLELDSAIPKTWSTHVLVKDTFPFLFRGAMLMKYLVEKLCWAPLILGTRLEYLMLFCKKWTKVESFYYMQWRCIKFNNLLGFNNFCVAFGYSGLYVHLVKLYWNLSKVFLYFCSNAPQLEIEYWNSKFTNYSR